MSMQLFIFLIIISIFKHNFYTLLYSILFILLFFLKYIFNYYILERKSEFIFILYFLFLLVMHNTFKKLDSCFRNTLHRKSCKTNFILRLGKNLYH